MIKAKLVILKALKLAIVWHIPALAFSCRRISTARLLLSAYFYRFIARRGPFLVRAFVCVCCPRTGSPRR